MIARSGIGLLILLILIGTLLSGCDSSRNALSELSWLSPPVPECDPCQYLDPNGYCASLPMCSDKESCCPTGTQCCSKNPEKPTVCCPADFTYCTTAGEKYGAPPFWDMNICGIERCDKEPYTKYCGYGSGACCKEDQECSYRVKNGHNIPVCTYPSCPDGTSSCGKPTEDGNRLCCSTNERCVTPMLRTPYCEKISCDPGQTLCSSTGNFKGTNFCCTKNQGCFVDESGLAHCV